MVSSSSNSEMLAVDLGDSDFYHPFPQIHSERKDANYRLRTPNSVALTYMKGIFQETS